MPDTEAESEKPRRWGAFVCPDCRFLFRVSRDHDGDGIICPSCRRMLRIPKEGDPSAPLMAPLQKVDFAEGEIDPRGVKRTRNKRKKKQKDAEIPNWDASSGSWRATRKKGKRVIQTISLWTLGVAAVLAVAFLLVDAGETEASDPPTAEDGKLDQFDDLVQAPAILPKDETEDSIELPVFMNRSETEFLALAQPLAEQFLSATNVDQILALVNDSARVEEKVRQHYPAGNFTPEGMSKFNATGRVSYKDTFAAVTVLTPDFEKKQLAFIDAGDGLKIDWESWVGWCEVPWQRLSEVKPNAPVLVRALLKSIDYYNFGFADEDKWRSYRLMSPNGEHMLYGYVERDSLLDQRLRPSEATSTVAVTLKIRFPEGDKAGKQVIIDEYISEGWVIAEKSE